MDKMYSSGELAELANVDPKSVQNWTYRGLIVGQRAGDGKGHHFLFSLEDVITVAVANAMIANGISIRLAFTGARVFRYETVLPDTYLLVVDGGVDIRLVLAEELPPPHATSFVAINLSKVAQNIRLRHRRNQLAVAPDVVQIADRFRRKKESA